MNTTPIATHLRRLPARALRAARTPCSACTARAPLADRAARRAARTIAAAACAMLALSACTTAPGPTLSDAVPDLEHRTGAPITSDLPWDEPSTAWDGAAPLDLHAALATALQNNRALRRTLTEVAQRRARYQDSQLPPNPMLDIGAGIPIDMGVTPILAMLGTQVDWLWKREAITGETNAALRTVLFEAAALTVATAVETRAAYVSVASAQEILALSDADAAVATRVMHAATARFEAGEGSAVQVNESRMSWSEALSRAMDAQQALVVAKTQLLAALGRGDIGLSWSTRAATAREAIAECTPQVPPYAQDHADLMALVREHRLDLRAAEARVEGARQRVQLAKAGQWPAVNLAGGWERDMEGDSAVMFNAQISLPVFNQGQFRVAAAEADLEIARIDADALWQQALLEAWRARGALATMEHHTVQLRDVTLEAFASNKRILADRVNAGEAAPVRLWQSEHQENHIRIQLAHSQRESALAAFAFERALIGARLPVGPGMGGGGGGGMTTGGGMADTTPIGATGSGIAAQEVMQ